jgi:hypothetical protein
MCVVVLGKMNLSFSDLFHHTVSTLDRRASTAELPIQGDFEIMLKEALAEVFLGIFTSSNSTKTV